jgi:hypothetical protein
MPTPSLAIDPAPADRARRAATRRSPAAVPRALAVFPGLSGAPPNDPRLEREVWSARAAMAREEAREAREQARTAVWFAQRAVAYRRWLLAEARTALYGLGSAPSLPLQGPGAAG